MLKLVVITGIFMLTMTSAGFAAHPLITDDAGTQGKGKTQLEFIGEYGQDKENGVTEKSFVAPAIPVLSYGINDDMDIVLGIPLTSVTTEKDGTSSRVRGIADASIELKARLYQSRGFSIAVKPGLRLPSGNEEKGLGNGKLSYSTFLIATKETGPWAVHFNIGYVRNEYKLQADQDANRKDIWHVSAASEFEVIKGLKAVTNIGMERNPDKTSNTNPAFVLGGFIYSLTENLDVDFGIKKGLNRPETDITYLAGITLRL